MIVTKANKNWLVILIAVFFALVASIAFLSWPGDSEYSAATRDKFIADCLSSTQNEAYCACTFESLQEKLSSKDFDALEARLEAGTAGSADTQLLNDVAGKCASENNSF